MEISLAAEKIFSIAGVEITNSVLSAVIVVAVIISLTLLIGRNLRFENPGKVQLVLEMLIEALMSQISGTLGMARTKKIFSFVFTFFVFILFSNLFGLLPFVPAIGLQHDGDAATLETNETAVVQAETLTAETEQVEPDLTLSGCLKSKECFLTTQGVKEFTSFSHLFRAPTSDLSMTITLALIAVFMINLLGVVSLKLSYFKKFFNFSNVIFTVAGLLELISEFSRIISFSFRLFGNIFAGETLLAVITNLSFGVATLPFLFLELFVAFIQAFVFFMLTSIFIGLATARHEDH